MLVGGRAEHYGSKPPKDLVERLRVLAAKLSITYAVADPVNGMMDDGIEFSLKRFFYDYSGYVAIMDSDMFPLKPFSVINYLQKYNATLSAMPSFVKNDHFQCLYLYPGLQHDIAQTILSRP